MNTNSVWHTMADGNELELEYLPVYWRQFDGNEFAGIFEELMRFDAHGIGLKMEEMREWCRIELERLCGFEPGIADYRYCAYLWMKSGVHDNDSYNHLLHSLMNAIAVIGRIGKGNS